MKLTHPADLFVPDGLPLAAALARTTHLGIGAHADDLEIMAAHGILACYRRSDAWFTGVTCTDGAGSPRAGLYAACSNDEMVAVRLREQRQAAVVGEYAAMLQLGYTSAQAKDPRAPELRQDLRAILQATRPEVVYTHNLADKHPSHVAVASRVLQALRSLPPAERPARLLGCEVWRDLDWLDDAAKQVLDVGAHPAVAAALVGVFDSQIAGGKRYDLASQGRRRANATYLASHGTDACESASIAMDLTPLLADDRLDPAAFVQAHLERFAAAVRQQLQSQWGA